MLVKQDNTDAFEALYNKYWERFYTICYWHLLDREGAKDVIQELFVELWVKRQQINIVETVEGYLKIAARNRLFNYIRSQDTRRKHTDNAAGTIAGAELNTDTLNREKELRRLYHNEISKLPPKMKEVYQLVKEEGFSISEVAERLSLSEQTVKNQLGSAVKKIRAGLEHYRLLLIVVWIYLLNL